MTFQYSRYAFVLATLLLVGCSGGINSVRNTLGLNKAAPDEFAVVRRAPLEVPPPYAAGGNLPKPRLGAPRPQELAPDEAARKTLFGTDNETEAALKPATPRTQSERSPDAVTKSAADSAFLTKAGTQQADPSVRSVIDAETVELHDRNKPVAERLFNYGGDASVPSATVVDAQAEADRIREALNAGQPINEGETPYREE